MNLCFSNTKTLTHVKVWGPGMLDIVEHNMKTNMRRESFLKIKAVLILGVSRDL